MNRIQLSLLAPLVELPAIDLTSHAKGQWVTVTQSFTKQQRSTDKDRMRISIDKKDLPAGNKLIFIDDISIRRPESSE